MHFGKKKSGLISKKCIFPDVMYVYECIFRYTSEGENGLTSEWT